MFRRDFLQQVTVGAGGLAAAGAARGAESRIVSYKIDGFSCVTCAVGLEVMLRQQKGIVKVKASYPERQAVIEFDPEQINEDSIKNFIDSIGFKVLQQ